MITAREMASALHDAEQYTKSVQGEEVREPRDILAAILGHLKGLYWFHWSAHWQTAGENFYGDHLLFERLKDAVEAEIDPLAEKIVAYYGAGVVDPAHVMEHEHEVMGAENEPSHVYRAYQMEKDLQTELQTAYDELKAQDALPMGLDDFIMSMAHTHDSHVYLLQQRMGGKRGSRQAGGKQAFNSLEKSWMGQSSFAPMRNALGDDLAACDHLEMEWVGHIDPDDPEAI
jgi:DNA-binding ferritin-like protein